MDRSWNLVQCLFHKSRHLWTRGSCYCFLVASEALPFHKWQRTYLFCISFPDDRIYNCMYRVHSNVSGLQQKPEKTKKSQKQILLLAWLDLVYCWLIYSQLIH